MPATLTWLGCSTFQLEVEGINILLDAYVDRAVGADGPRFTSADITRADWILVGHSHFDHLWGAETIAARTGAKVVGSYETFRVLRDSGLPARQLLPVGGGETIVLGDGVTVSVFPSLHSASWAHRTDPPVDEECFGDQNVSYQERRSRERSREELLGLLDEDGRDHLTKALSLGARGDGGPLVYVITCPEGRLLFQDTAGCWSGVFSTLEPDVAIISAAGRGNLDGEPWQGSLAQFIARETELLSSPRRLILAHHDNWLPGFSTPGDARYIRETLTNPAIDVTQLGYAESYPAFA
jgi:hypothetical protein